MKYKLEIGAKLLIGEITDLVKGNLFSKLKNLQFCLIHQGGTDSDEILNQIHRIGCRCDLIWPPTSKTELAYDVVITELEVEHYTILKLLLKKRQGFDPTLIALVDYESPKTLEIMMEFDASAVLTKPVHNFGILATLVLARWNWQKIRKAEDRVTKLETRLAKQVLVGKAIAVVMKKRQLSEQDAYNLIRSQAMSKRIAVVELCESLITAYDIL